MQLRATGLFLAAFAAPHAFAHQQPTTLIALDTADDHVTMSVHLPLPELELAFGHQVTEAPERRIAAWSPDLRRYLAAHIRPAGFSGQPWTVRVGGLSIDKSEQSQSGPFQEVTASVTLIPPSGESVRRFTLHYDAILHQVVTHKVLVSVRSDWLGGRNEPVRAGTIAVDTGTSRINPLEVDLGGGSWWTGFAGMVRLGEQHIREGLDHLLFLIVLLLPATLTVRGDTWGGFGGTQYSLVRLAKIVTAFTCGHSITLLIGALHLLKLPQQPVEIAIACSILVTAVHAIRPVFPGREAQVAAGFGLVHGLAFATVLADLHLPPGPMALSILGFNLGIELMQLFVIAVTSPWLVLVSLTPSHRWVRYGGAVLAATAAVGWIANRVSGQANLVERWLDGATTFAPLGILLLALIAIPSYLFNNRWNVAGCLNERGTIE